MLRTLKDPKVAMLAEIGLFRDLDRAHLRHVAGLVDVVDVEAGRSLVRRGERGLEFFVIVEGAARVELDGDLLATLGPGDFFGELSILDNGPRTADVTAASPMRLLVLERRAFASLLDEEPVVGARILRAVGGRVAELEEHWRAG